MRGLAVLQLPDMRELSVQRFARGLVNAGVAASDEDEVTSVMKLLWRGREAILLGYQAHKDAVQNRVRPHVGVAVRIWEIIGFAPFHLWRHGAQHGGHIAFGKGGVQIANHINVWLGQGCSF